MHMLNVEVFTTFEGNICIAQNYSENGEVIEITPEQAELFCKWIKKAAKLLMEEKNRHE